MAAADMTTTDLNPNPKPPEGPRGTAGEPATVIDSHRRKPRPLFAFNDPILDDPDRVDEALEGFGAE